MSYQRYVELYISETESYRLDLPDRIPLQAVACVWRIVIISNSETSNKLSSKSLIGCLRIDSYFNPLIVPKIQAALNVRAFHISFHNHLDLNCYDALPPPLSNYKLNGMIPETQCFASIEHKQATFLFNKWPDNSLFFSVTGSISAYLLDYGLLLLQEVLDTAKIEAQISITDDIDLTLICQPFSLKLSPSIFHTLSLAAHLWNNMLNRTNKCMLVLTTRYAIANNMNIPIRFGQSGSNGNILLESRQCHFYSWRLASNQVLYSHK
jgi:vacuolar protein sorting-associated protein 13B